MLVALEVVYFDIGDTLVGEGAQWLPGAKEALTGLRALGLRLGVISNTGELTRKELALQLPPDFDWTLFEPDLVVLSSEVGLAKPSPTIFQLAIVRAGVEAAQCLFCTEELPHTLVAQAVGMRAARVEKPPHSDVGELASVLKSAGLVAPR